MIYLTYQIEGIEGLCNQLMAIFRTIGEAAFYVSQNLPAGIILDDVQTRNSIDLEREPYFSRINIDSFLDVDGMTKTLAARNILVERFRDDLLQNENQMVVCRRFPRRFMSPSESRELGLFIARSVPFSKRALRLAGYIMDYMSYYPNWKALHLRVEGDLVHLPSVRSIGLTTYVKNQLQQTIDMLSSTPDLSAAYLATGIQDEKYMDIASCLHERFPKLILQRKKDVLKTDSGLLKEFESLCLEEQALVDWLVCLGAPLFVGQHTSSFAYLASYMRHYRGFSAEATELYQEHQPLWDEWFPRV